MNRTDYLQKQKENREKIYNFFMANNQDYMLTGNQFNISYPRVSQIIRRVKNDLKKAQGEGQAT